MWSSQFVGLSVCLSVSSITKSCGSLFMVGLGTRNGLLDLRVIWICGWRGSRSWFFALLTLRNKAFRSFSELNFSGGITACPHHSLDQDDSKCFVGPHWLRFALTQCCLVFILIFRQCIRICLTMRAGKVRSSADVESRAGCREG